MPTGRPGTTRTKLLQVKVTPEEYMTFEDRSQASELSLSDWVRITLNRAPTLKIVPVDDTDKPEAK